ncbi:MAG TPA: 2,3-bisphosphoglycerate-dependent phosphoglycerate mutase [Candidatus Kapabacteria bacterium]|nr:2,3-bisphosphoglycerate-dependent phosphoglycerate mutase [Candidatus Kapabacteria bacterium]HYM34265.1 2,3-bisphosphoglycerate-dependent phosphoglycerate mutase [Steroidobacteraceae bacterium]
MSKLILLRHGESEWNKENRFTGWIDIGLSDQGRRDAYECGKLLKDIPIDVAFTSVLIRAIDTTTEALRGADQELVPIVKDAALNERMYGDLQGKNKAESAKEFGADQVKIWRRSYDVPPPNGESLKDTAARTLPYFDKNIMPLVTEGKNVLVSAHGNSLRAIVMELDKLTKDEVVELNIPNAEPIIYEIDENGKILSKETLKLPN